VSGWNASVVKAAGPMMVGFSGLLLICALSLIARIRSPRLRVDRAIAALGLTGAVGWLLTSAVLYITYRPYSQIFERFVRAGDVSQIRELSEFLGSTSTLMLLYVRSFAVNGTVGYEQRDIAFYFWIGVTLLGLGALSLIAARHIVRRRHAGASA
jgi:hypothetical protein